MNLHNIEYYKSDGEHHYSLYDVLACAEEVRGVRIFGYVGKAFQTDRLPEEFWELPNLERIDIIGCPLRELPPEIAKIKTLREIELTDCRITTLPPELTKLKKLTKLYLGGNPLDWSSLLPLLQALPRFRSLDMWCRDDDAPLDMEIAHLSQLRELKIKASRYAQWDEFFDAVADGCPRLEQLTLECRNFRSFPESVCKLSKLKFLRILGEPQTLPSTIGKLRNLQVLEFGRHRLAHFPDELCQLRNLRRLDAGSGRLRELPAEFDRLTKLEEVLLRCNKLKAIPGNLGRLKRLRNLELDFNQLDALPTGLEKLEQLEHYDFQDNADRTLQEQAAKIVRGPLRELKTKLPLDTTTLTQTRLEQLDLDFNGHTLTRAELRWLEKQTRLRELRLWKASELPEGFGKIPSLEQLTTPSATFDRLPKGIGGLTGLKELNIDDTALVHLPKSMTRLKSLETWNVRLERADTFCGPASLTKLRLRSRDTMLPDVFGNFRSLESILLMAPKLQHLPPSFAEMPKLERLEIWHLDHLDLADAFRTLARIATLRRLELNKCSSPLPSEIGLLSQLKTLDVTEEAFVDGPFPDLSGMHSLTHILLNRNRLERNRQRKAEIKKSLPNAGKGWKQVKQYGMFYFYRSL